jgi:small subunit ribosomal protein S4
MQARQVVVHGHFLLNGKKHNVPSYYVKEGDTITLRPRLKESSLYASSPVSAGQAVIPSWLKVNKSSYELEVVNVPNTDEVSMPVDVLKVIEFYARA